MAHFFIFFTNPEEKCKKINLRYGHHCRVFFNFNIKFDATVNCHIYCKTWWKPKSLLFRHLVYVLLLLLPYFENIYETTKVFLWSLFMCSDQTDDNATRLIITDYGIKINQKYRHHFEKHVFVILQINVVIPFLRYLFSLELFVVLVILW